MHTKRNVVVIVLCVVVVGVGSFYAGARYGAKLEADMLVSVMTPDLKGASYNTAPTVAGTGNVQWAITPAGVSPTDSSMPRTKVAAVIGGVSYDGGIYNGNCEIIQGKVLEYVGLLAGELSGVQCWWGGEGDEVGVFREGNKFFLKHGELGPGASDTMGVRGNFTILKSL